MGLCIVEEVVQDERTEVQVGHPDALLSVQEVISIQLGIRRRYIITYMKRLHHTHELLFDDAPAPYVGIRCVIGCVIIGAYCCGVQRRFFHNNIVVLLLTWSD